MVGRVEKLAPLCGSYAGRYADYLGVMRLGDKLLDSALLASGETPVKDYLFHSSDGLITFVVIEEEMAQLNDYCLLCLNGVSKRISELGQEYRELQSGERRIVDPDFGDATTDAAWYISDVELLRWQDTQEFLVQAMCLLLMSAFTEKSLKSLCSDFALSSSVHPKMIKGQSKTSSYLHFLRESCNLTFDEPRESLAIRERCRRLRNSFAHGEWEDVRQEVAQISLQRAFFATTTLFQSIEKAYLSRSLR
jgi:hypothetical protein